jgi:protein gp37
MPKLDLIIVGAETGPGARPCEWGWIRSVVQQCKAAGVPVWVKALLDDKGRKVPFENWPEDLRVRQRPAVVG